MPQTSLTSANVSIPDNSISESKLDFAIDKFPTGSVVMHAGSTAPDGWLLCNGEQLPNGVGTVQGKEADFSALYTMLGTTYGAEGELPDCRGIFIRGAGGQTIGGKNYSTSRGSKVGDRTISHNHSISGNVTSNITSNISQQSSSPFPAIRYAGTALSNRQAITAVSGISSFNITKEYFWGTGSTSTANPQQTGLPSVTTSISNTHNLSASNQTGGSSETAPASIGLNYIIKI